MIPTADALLAGLDEQQRVAAEALVGPVCMLAGAGTGKTRAITHRIAYGVATGAYTPNRVMALTFTSRAASELRGRLRDLGASGVAARTFHSAALSQLNFFWPQVVGGQSPSILDGKARLLGHVAERLKLRLDTATLRDVAGEIEWRKVSGLSFEAYGDSLATRGLPGRLTAEQAIEIQRGYETLKDERHQLDFEDVLLTMAGMIEQEPSVAMQVREQYRFFVVDEYQDVSPLQDQLLSLWVGDRHELCVVGDASQTIYSFAGARAEYLLNFPNRYPDATVVRLEQNYRSTPAVIETANRLMRGRPGALMLHAAASGTAASAAPAAASGASNAAANAAHGPAVAINAYPSDMAEARAIAQKVLELISGGVKAQDIAVLYRINVQAATLEAAFNDVGVSYQIRGSKRFFDLPEVKQAVMALRAASISIVGEPLFKSVSDVLRGVGWSQSAPDTRGAVRDRWESLNALMGLVDLAAPGTNFRAFTDELMERQLTQHEPAVAAVTFATLHSAKGLEWENVFVVGVSEGLIPISYAQTPEQIDEERRLLYVGVTRAKRRLELSWAATGPQQRTPRERSRFLDEIERFNPTGSRTAGAGGARRG